MDSKSIVIDVNHPDAIVYVERNIISNVERGIAIWGNGTGYITDNIIYNSDQALLELWAEVFVTGNLLFDNYYSILNNSSHSNTTHLTNNIFARFNNSNPSDFATGTYGYIRFENPVATLNNCIYNVNYTGENTMDNFPVGFGEIGTTNNNGHPADTWSNIFVPPMLTDVDNGDYTPLEGSPLIDAGSPNYLDEDGSISDIGVAYYDWGTTAPELIEIAADNPSGTVPLIVQFSSEIEGPAVTYNWSFGDGQSSTLSRPVHIYSTPGNYNVSLTVEGPGGTSSIIEQDFINANEPTSPPIANFTASTTSGLVPLDVDFSNLSANQIDSYSWDFGDGNTSTDENPSHVYESSGSYTVSLTATGPYGEDTIIFDDLISALEPEAVVANFEANTQECIAPCTINLTNLTIGTIESYSWDFGDGNTSTDENPVHTYNEIGTYTITLDANGQLNGDSMSMEIEVLSDTPIITSITDIPNDQGGRVLINFLRSGYDQSERTEFYTAEMNIDGGWVTANFSPPYGDDEYGFIVNTLVDSSSVSNGLTDFRVIANMDEGVFISDIVQGYSVDNIHPTTPENLSGSHDGDNVLLSWNYEQEADFNYHQINNTGHQIEYTTENQITLTQDSFFNESTVQSVDIHDNQSSKSNHISIHKLHDGNNLISMSVLGQSETGAALESLEQFATNIIGEGQAATQLSQGTWVGSLSSIEHSQGYWVRLNSDDKLIIPGNRVVCQELNYNLNTGNNLISFCCEEPISVNNIPPQCTSIIGEGVASTYFNNIWIGNIEELEPGRGYWLKCDQDVQFNWDCLE